MLHSVEEVVVAQNRRGCHSLLEGGCHCCTAGAVELQIFDREEACLKKGAIVAQRANVVGVELQRALVQRLRPVPVLWPAGEREGSVARLPFSARQ